MIELNKKQIQRLYMVFDFEDEEKIVNATMDCDRGGWLKINCINNKTNSTGCHKLYLAKHSREDLDKVNFILNGIKLERNPS